MQSNIAYIRAFTSWNKKYIEYDVIYNSGRIHSFYPGKQLPYTAREFIENARFIMSHDNAGIETVFYPV